MANPSLQIGNSNWAIKEDNLLGYSTAGTRFVPQPITMTRESAGTRVNSSGLVETVELLGSEEIEDGGFPTPNTAWDVFNGATISGGKANIVGDGSAFGYISQSSVFTNGKTYKVTLDAVITSGGGLSVKYSTAYADNIGFITTTGSYTFYYTATSDYNLVIGRTQNGVAYDSSVTNISIKESTKNNLARVDYDGTASSLLVEPERTNVFIQNDISTWNGFSSYAGNTTAPDGTTINFVNMEDRRIFPTTTIINSTEYTSSIYLKGNKTADVKLRNTAANDTVITLSTEWQRFELTATSVSTVTNTLLIDARFSQGMGVSGLEVAVYGGQTEVGSYPTSYIPTDGGTVTRNQDQYSKTGISNLINSEEGVLFVEMAALSDDETNREITLSDGIGSNYVLIRFNSGGSNRIYTRVDVGGALEYYDLNTSHTITNNNKIAIRWGASNFATFINGVEAGSQLSGSSFSADTLTELNFDNGAGGGNFYGKVKQLQVFKTALTDPELVTLTTI